MVSTNISTWFVDLGSLSFVQVLVVHCMLVFFCLVLEWFFICGEIVFISFELRFFSLICCDECCVFILCLIKKKCINDFWVMMPPIFVINKLWFRGYPFIPFNQVCSHFPRLWQWVTQLSPLDQIRKSRASKSDALAAPCALKPMSQAPDPNQHVTSCKKSRLKLTSQMARGKMLCG